MELKICCDSSIKLDKMMNIANIRCTMKEYEVNQDTLNGIIEIQGDYNKDDMEQKYDFIENVPFTVVFKDDQFNIQGIEAYDFQYQEIINQGIECNFNIIVTYENRTVPNNKIEEILTEEVEKKEDVEETHIEEDEKYSKENIAEEENYNEEIIIEVDELTDDIDEQTLKEDINKKYDMLLQKILDSRDDNFLEENNNVTISTNNKENSKPIFKGKDEHYSSYRVYYNKKEYELESICKKENISIQKLYSDNSNNNYIDKRRIIIK